MAPGYERGLGFLPGAAVDQHFSQRRRQPDTERLAATHPQLLGIGIDEATALIVTGNQAEVIGWHRVHFYAGTAKKEVTPAIVEPRGIYDLRARRVLKPGGVKRAVF
jgi:cyanophycinase-like exopeptidase